MKHNTPIYTFMCVRDLFYFSGCVKRQLNHDFSKSLMFCDCLFEHLKLRLDILRQNLDNSIFEAENGTF